MRKNPVLVIADPENHDLYHALPLWDEQVEIYTFAAAAYHSQAFSADLALIDCGFDDDHGLWILREITLKNPEVPVMFVTSAGSEKTAVEAFRIGVRDYIKRPIDLLEFSNAILNFLNATRSHSWEEWRRHLTHTTSALHADAQEGIDVPANLLRCIRYIKENFATPISLDAIAQEGGLSKSHFCRKFKRITGMTPMHFLSRIRIKRSKDLLTKDLPVSTVAMKVGFNDLSSFNRHFRELVGLSPTDYRKSLR